MISITTLLQTFRDALQASADLDAFGQTRYGRSPRIYVGVDKRQPPGESEAPFVILRPDTASEGQTAAAYSYRLMVDWAVRDEEVNIDSQVTEYAGIYQLDEMGGYIWEALTQASGNLDLDSREYTLEAVEFYPLLVAGFDITIEVPQVMGGEITL